MAGTIGYSEIDFEKQGKQIGFLNLPQFNP